MASSLQPASAAPSAPPSHPPTSLMGSSSPPSLPSSSTFSFKAPYPATLKQRRVSLALPSSPRVVPAANFRDDTGIYVQGAETSTEGSPLKISSEPDAEETMPPLEKKARKKWSPEETQMLVDGCNKHGVGNWKTILGDPAFTFDGRSPVDLKDRFRTYFPDAYRTHYPNARTHLSTKVRSTLPDGSSLFEKTRSKKRRPFTEAEDIALKAGYDKHGTVWAVIVKDPIFQEHNRRSTDLRDRFRNAFPDLYTAAGYKPRGGPRKKSVDSPSPIKMPMRAATDDQLAMTSSGASTQQRKRRRYTSQGLLRGGTKSVPQSAAPSDNEASDCEPETVPGPSNTFKRPTPSLSTGMFPPVDPGSESMSEVESLGWSSGLDTPIHSSQHGWTGSPTSSSNVSDFFLNSPPRDAVVGGMGMIGNSAWGTQDWFSPNPRMDPTGSSSFPDNNPTFSPSSPFSFHQSHGVVDRYDLVPSSWAHDFQSEVGSSAFSDDVYPPRREYHSDYAGDLIFGARTQSGQSAFYDSPPDFIGLGLTGMHPAQQQQPTSVHPMALHSSSLPGIDEIELSGISLNDHSDSPPDHRISSPDVSMSAKDDDHTASFLMEQRFNFDDLVDLSQDEMHQTPPATPQTRPRRLHQHGNIQAYPMSHGRSISVPPAERMAVPSPMRPGQVHTNSQPEIRGYSFGAQHHSRSDVNLASTSATYAPQSFSSLFHSTNAGLSQDMSKTASEISALPFLDLHYYGGPGGGGNGGEAADESMRVGQALDLASTASWGSGGMMPSFQQQQPMAPPPPQMARMPVGAGGGMRMGAHQRGHSVNAHQRGQSAVVCPQDLMRSDTNKRKRMSWDGAQQG
ncbi:hypothetical protein CYLTODRAFT_444894 [Cylindrobasidium torrendii FP15055 ss-10]|uniref:Myb-like domain-containing protein n=1 Tax=Cylindrobasidium torrendii FP15055 ss-10 TaxID=1314674 RepID=A0A0D7B7J1_9AGAR|nr:hypothetical protein CYLTODRAFT_444894 [Cylindrobasidium torrendii FP15055 ss-10]